MPYGHMTVSPTALLRAPLTDTFAASVKRFVVLLKFHTGMPLMALVFDQISLQAWQAALCFAAMA